ncbi:Glycosyltransferase involved in cell wall biogenesis [Rubellimicrobium thermophilum DSM 16684]|uniref:Glycosyltransferase involved in cell wall biogenesis n=1 Tax=Rubellimicrobium thermophilum DSM 16684 TaxID=1123069 RepID=S9R2G1_9RHOB|nr:glycosyltransferase family 2 protein [Rubellimicrobium thermophilum]EPX86133.1 Glycosyltransferase involved in cell wall biogenesis [Rubellimicrobium thermophilum DSM 16684]
MLDRRLSVVIPAYNEEGAIAALVQETFAVLPAELLGEVIVVDDASADGTAGAVRALIPLYGGRLRLIRHAARAGQSAAVRSGVAAARMRLVGTMDGDGQNPPADLARLAAAWAPEGPQLVGGHRTTRRDSWSKRIGSRIGNGVRRALLRDDCPDSGCGLKVFERDRHLALPFFHGQHRYLPALFRAQGCTALFLPVGDRPRQHGRSNYTNWRRALQGVPDLLGVAWLVRRARPVAAQEEGA